MSDDAPLGGPFGPLHQLETLANIFGMGWQILAEASPKVKALLGARFRIPFEALTWATETVAADIVAAFRGRDESALTQRVTAEANALADRVSLTVRDFLERRGLLAEVEVQHGGWHRGDDDAMHEVKGTFKGKRIRWDRFIDADDRAKLETVTVDGEARELLAFDVLLAELFDELGQKATADRVRATPAEERGKRWRRDDETPDGWASGTKACLAVVRAVWARILAERARATKEAEEREERARKVPVASMHGLTAAVAMGLGRAGDTPTLRGQAAGIVAYAPDAWAELLAVLGTDGQPDARRATVGDTAGVVAAWLARVVHRQWLADSRTADKVEIVASKAMLASMGLGLVDRPAEVLEAALSLLAGVRLMGGADDKQPGSGRLVLDYFKAPRTEPGEKGGRPSSVYVVTVGWPLKPTMLEALAAERGFTIPRELAFYGPVLDAAWAPLTGNTRTAAAQRLAFAVGAGQWLVSRREEYAERGGVRLDTLRPFLQSMGLYHRSHASLADDVAVEWRTAPAQTKLPGLGPKGPLLVPAKVEGVYRLGPDYKAQEALVLRNAELTAKAKAGQKRGKRKA